MSLRDGDNWEIYAACKGLPVDLFFPDVGGAETNAAKAICAPCPVREQCLNSVIHIGRRDDHGVWAGTSRDERQKIRMGRALGDAA